MFRLLLSWILMFPFMQPTKLVPNKADHTHAITTIIFDMDGVLCTTDTKKFLSHVGLKNVMRFILGTGKFPSNKTVLEALKNYPAQIDEHSNPEVYSLNQGNKIPNIMLDWQCGKQIEPHDIAQWIDNNHQIAPAAKQFLLNTTRTMFTPELFIATRKVIPGGLALARSLKQAGYRIVLLSNWDGQSFELLQQHFPELFTQADGNNLFDMIYTSAQLSQKYHKPLLKPMTELYTCVLEELKAQTTEYAFASHNCVLIDDEQENCLQARACHLHAVRANPKSMKKTHKQVSKVLALYNHEKTRTEE